MSNPELIDLQMQQTQDYLDTNVVECSPETDAPVITELTGCVENYDGEFQNKDDWVKDYDC